MTTGVERFPQSARYLPGDGSKQSGGRCNNAVSKGLAGGRWNEKVSNDECAHAALTLWIYGGVIHYLQDAEADVVHLPRRCMRGRCYVTVREAAAETERQVRL